MAELAADTAVDDGEEPKRVSRSDDLLGRKGSKLRKKLDALYDAILKGWQDQSRRSDDQMDWWNCYNCVLDSNQFYNGNAEIYVPIVRDAINAVATRLANQLFPNSGRYVEVTSADGKQPMDLIALLDHYIRKKNLEVDVAKPLVINGYIEGQFNLYVDWSEVHRVIVSRETRGPTINQDGVTLDVDGEEIEDIEEEEVVDGAPAAEVLHDCDVLVWPANADSIDEALAAGGGVAICRRVSKAKIEAMRDAGEFDDAECDDLLEMMDTGAKDEATEGVDLEKRLAEAVGVRKRGTEATLWEVWHMLPISDKGGFSDKGDRRLCRIWFGPKRMILGAKRNPYWNDLCPLLSRPKQKVSGVFKGKSAVEPIASLQYEANDAANEGADSAHYAALPIVVADTTEAPGPFILNLAAVWQAKPDAIRFMDFPDLTPRAITRIQYCSQAIFQSIGVNPSMLPNQTGSPGRKRNQAEVALEQQVDIMSAASEAKTLEAMFTDMMGWFIDLDYQFRDTDLTIRQFGVYGIHAAMAKIPPLQNRSRYYVRWFGIEQARNVAQQQQMIAGLNVLQGMGPMLQAEGYKIQLWPLAEMLAMSVFGARTGAQVLVDARHQSSLPIEMENELLAQGHEVPVQPMDQDIEHIRGHMSDPAVAMSPNGKMHIAKHMKAIEAKKAAAAQQAMLQAMQGQQGSPQGRPGPPTMGRPGPRPGAQPQPPRQMQRPNGMVRPDNLPQAGALTMPRRM